MNKQQCIEWVRNNIPIMVKSKYPFTSQYAFDSVIQCLGERLYDKNQMTEKEKVKQLGEELGYGQMMKLASELWEEDMIAHGYPTTGVLIPALKSDIKIKQPKPKQ